MAAGLIHLQAFLLVLPPVFGETQVPTRIRIGLATALAAALSWGLPLSFPPELSISGLAGGALRETLIGLTGGLGARMVLEASSGAGYWAGTSMGLGYGTQAGMGSDSPAISQLTRLLTLGALVTMGAPRQIICALYASLRAFPVGADLDVVRLAQTSIGFGLFSTALAVRVAFPVVAASLLGHVAIGIAGKAAPQVNLQSVGFSASILAGGAALYASAPLIAKAVGQATLSAAMP
jgi:flagellar biosynthetic protein FliR